MKLSIQQCENGWIVIYDNHMSDGKLQEVIEYDPDSDLSELEACVRMLQLVNEQIGVPYSKHRESNILIENK